MKTVNILLAFPFQRATHKAEIEERLYEELCNHGFTASMVPASTREKALARFDEAGVEPDLLVSHMLLPSSTKSNPDQRGGLKLVQELRRRRRKTPAILLSEIIDNTIQNAREKLEACRLVIERDEGEDEDWMETLLKCCCEAIGEKPLLQGGKVDITLDIDQFPQGRYSMTAPGLCVEGAHLILDKEFMKQLARRSTKTVPQVAEWREEFHDIGNNLLRELKKANEKFDRDFNELINCAGGHENVRIRFSVEKTAHPIALEALLDDRDDYWMLHAPVYRRVQVDGVRSASLEDCPLRCLIIQVDTWGTVPGIIDQCGQEVVFPRMSNVKKEGLALNRFLNEKTEVHDVEKVERLGGRRKATLDRVEETLTNEGPWPLVHFAGHSHYDNERDTGYVLLSGKTGPQLLTVEDFARYLRRAKSRFIYLSSCHSSSADFAFALAKQGVPAIVGFRWDIEDDKAAEHADIFYHQLFEGPRKFEYEYAFLETRKKMYHKWQDNRIWAAAMLIIQVEQH